MAGTWPADVSKRDVSLALCQDKLQDQDEEATVGKEGAMSMHLSSRHIFGRLSFHLLPPTAVPVMLLEGAWLVTVKSPFSLVVPHKEVMQAFEAILMLYSARGHPEGTKG